VVGGVSVAGTEAVLVAVSVGVIDGEGVEVAVGDEVTVLVPVLDGDGVTVFVGLG